MKHFIYEFSFSIRVWVYEIIQGSRIAEVVYISADEDRSVANSAMCVAVFCLRDLYKLIPGVALYRHSP
jgi:hypothetical protein